MAHGKLDMSIFDAFDVSLWPTSMALIEDYIPGSIKEISELVNVDFGVEVQLEFNALVKTLLKTNLYCTTRKSSALDFWSGVLREYGVMMSNELKWVIQSITIIPYSSAEAERR